jgi:hypothetical protein
MQAPLGALVKADAAKWSPIIKKLRIKAECKALLAITDGAPRITGVADEINPRLLNLGVPC